MQGSLALQGRVEFGYGQIFDIGDFRDWWRWGRTCGEESLLHSIAVVYVDVHVQHALVILQQLEYGQHDIIDVAEA